MNEFYLITLLLLIGYSMFHYIYFKRLTKKQILLSFLPGLFILILNILIFRGIDQEIIRQIPAILYDSTDQSDVTQTTIFIRGTLTKKLFSDDDFYGIITLDETHISSHELMHFHLFESNQTYFSSNRFFIESNAYNSESLNPPHSFVLGFYASNDLSTIALKAIDKDIIVVGPATTLDEAITVQEEVIKNFFKE